MEQHIRNKRNELIWALSLQEYSHSITGFYTHAQIGRIFNIDRSTVKRIVDGMPKDWKPKWVKAE